MIHQFLKKNFHQKLSSIDLKLKIGSLLKGL